MELIFVKNAENVDFLFFEDFAIKKFILNKEKVKFIDNDVDLFYKCKYGKFSIKKIFKEIYFKENTIVWMNIAYYPCEYVNLYSMGELVRYYPKGYSFWWVFDEFKTICLDGVLDRKEFMGDKQNKGGVLYRRVLNSCIRAIKIRYKEFLNDIEKFQEINDDLKKAIEINIDNAINRAMNPIIFVEDKSANIKYKLMEILK